MMQNNYSQRPPRRPRCTHTALNTARSHVWYFVLFFLTIGALSLIAGPGVSWAAFGTVPPGQTPPSTVLVGPVDAVSLDAKTLTVAGVAVTFTDDTKIDERVGPLVAGAWARVEGNGSGGGGTTIPSVPTLAAVRIKVLPPMPLVRLTGPLDALTDTSLTVDGIPLFRTITTLVVGDPVAGEDRVAVRAAIQSDGSLLAIQVVKVNPIPDDDDGNDENDDGNDGPDQVRLTGQITQLPEDGTIGTWLVDGISVQVTADTQIHSHVGLLTTDAWVKVKGRVEGGTIIADQISTTRTRHFHKLTGTLTDLQENVSVTVNGLEVDLNPGASIRGNPQVGDRVHVIGELSLANTFVAILVDGHGHHDGGGGGGGEPGTPGLVVRFTGEVQQLPEGGLYGAWKIAGRDVNVPQGAFIDEHKAPAAMGAFVEVTALLGEQDSLTAVVIVVTSAANDNGGGGGDDGHDDGEWVEFTGTVTTLPQGDQAVSSDPLHHGNDLVGDWVVGDKTVHVGEHTEIEQHDQTIEIGVEVKVSGWQEADGSVRAAKIELHEHEDPFVQFVGVIQQLPDASHLGTWKVDDRDVVVDESTELNDEHGTFAVGQRVGVFGHQQDDGTVAASKIFALPQPEIQFFGRITSFPAEMVGDWVIGEHDKTVHATAETEFKQDNGVFSVGALVKVQGRLETDGSVTALLIETLPQPTIEHIGIIPALPENANGDLLGLWQVGLLTFEVNENTELDNEHGDFAVGVVVKAKGHLRSDGVVVADRIETKESHD